MLKYLALVAILLVGSASAQDFIEIAPPAWVPKPTPAIDCNFALGAYYNCPLDKTFSVTRASTKYCQWQSQLWMSVASGAPCITDQGWLIEEARTNLALWARDMTQSGTWVAVTMTAALNAVGIDGAANSATTLTSTSAAGTILQSLTAGSTAYTYTVYVKGVTVTGNIQVADYPVLTPAFTTLTSSNCFNPVTGVGTAPVSGQTIFVRCTVTATSLNPVIGFKFANNGDSIIVDFNQLEAASFGTSPILTTSASATRAQDSIQVVGLALTSLLASGNGTIITQTNPIQAGTTFPCIIGSQSAHEPLALQSTGTTQITGTDTAGSNAAPAALGSGSNRTLLKAALAWNPTGRSIVGNAGTPGTSTFVLGSVTSIFLGSESSGALPLDGIVQRMTLWPNKLPDAQLQMLTSLN